MAHDLTRKDLYDLVWTTPIKTLAERFGVSDVALAKACRRADIPVPARGYWAKKHSGKRVEQSLLPRRGLGMPDRLVLGQKPTDRYDINERALDPLPPAPQFSEDIEAVRSRVATMVGRVGIPKTFERAHRAVVELVEEDARRREKQLGQKYPSSWDAPFFDSAMGRRRLRIINALFCAVARAGGLPSVQGNGAEQCCVRVGQRYVRFIVGPVGGLPRHGSYDQGGKAAKPMQVAIERYDGAGDGLVWKDERGGQTVEDRIRDIAIELVVSGEREHRVAVERHYEWRVEEKARVEKEIQRVEEERIRKERERVERLEKQRIDRLLTQATSLTTAERIRDYVGRVLTLDQDDQVRPALETWARWARDQADRIDPVLNRQFESDLQPTDDAAAS